MNTNETCCVYEITVASEASEAVEFGLDECGALGTEINNLGVKPTEILTVIGYFDEPPDEKILLNHLHEALRIYAFEPDAIRDIASRRLGKVDWLYEWKKHWKPTVTAKFIIAPSWENLENTDKIVVRIEPNMAFGTGTHETTRLCLKAIEDYYEGGMSFLDVGTGTGILAIAAKKWRAESGESRAGNHPVLDSPLSTLDSFQACDTDADSIKIAAENAGLNEVDGIDFFVGSISAETRAADFVCANITLDVLLPILPLLLEKAKRILVLSGVLKEQEKTLTAELNKLQISDCKVETAGEWISAAILR